MAASKLIRRNLIVTVFVLIAMIFVMNFAMVRRNIGFAAVQSSVNVEQTSDVVLDDDTVSEIVVADADTAA